MKIAIRRYPDGQKLLEVTATAGSEAFSDLVKSVGADWLEAFEERAIVRMRMEAQAEEKRTKGRK